MYKLAHLLLITRLVLLFTSLLAGCDTWCPTDEDPDCAGEPDDGKYCTN